MGIALAVLILAAAAGFGVWVLARMTSLIRDLMQVTTGLTRLGVQIGRTAESTTQSRSFGAG
jgi:hypothetical protein